MNDDIVIFVTTFVKQYEDYLVKFLIEDGYAVSAYSENKNISTGNNELFVIAIKATKTNNKQTRSELYDKIKDIFLRNERSYFSLIIQELNCTNSVTWGVGKLFWPKKSEKSTGSPFRDCPVEE